MKKREGTKKRTTRNKIDKSCHPLPMVSLRVEEQKLLDDINKVKDFLINPYSDSRKIPRSTTRSRLKKLDRIGLIEYTFAQVDILETGKIYLQSLEKTRHETSRLGERKIAKKNEKSVHWHRFNSPIENRDKFRKEKLNFINCSWMENTGMKNWSEIVAKFDDATIIIKPKTLVIELKDIVNDDLDEIDAKCLRRVLEYIELLKTLGLETSGISVERGHWATVDSLLANVIYKKLGEKYFLELEDKKLFWIDFSPDRTGKRHKEHEVPDKLMKQNLDYNINQQLNDKFEFDKINVNSMNVSEIKESLGLITKDLGKVTYLEKLRIEDRIHENKLRMKELELKEANINKNTNTSQNFIPSYIC